ncbi:unnamed protein product [Bemisia tabaci]|uniref:LIM zinc-binding domain-containing protein n=1 Tax=Bemisia tabaci TaxID=7038 RepID=A0A9P0A1V8_BEMTA|nr:unnamed protein product [Bemisia tabaci]
MNTHYHNPYTTDLTSPHSPVPEFRSQAANGDHNHNHNHPHPGHPGGPHPGHPHHPPNHPHPHPHPHPVYGGPPHPHSAPVHHHHQQHHNPQAVQVCSGCNSKIVDRWFLRCLERNWHNNCLKCTACGATLADIGATCFTKPGMILCKNDYVRLFGQSAACAACSQMIPPSELVMRAGSAGGQGGGPGSGGPGPGAGPSSQVFHVKCFACSKCGLQLVSGDRYYLLGGAVVCEQDWHKFIKGSGISTQAQTTVRKGKVGRPRRSRD